MFFLLKPICLVLIPFSQMVKAISAQDWPQIDDMVKRLDITLSVKDREKTGKVLMRTIMRKFLPLADSLLETIFTHLPSPLVAQKYRTEILYDGDLEDEVFAFVYLLVGRTNLSFIVCQEHP